MKLEKVVLANAFALATIVLWVACSAIVFVVPDLTWQITQWWMHGVDISVMDGWNLTLTNFVLGGVTLTASAWVTGWVSGWAWGAVNKSK